MKKTESGYAPAPGFLRDRMRQMPEFTDSQMPEFVIHEYQPLLDSVNIEWKHWLQIAEDIKQNASEFDGFVIIHGTDTMAYTASTLPFLLHGLEKPVVITGSQIPLCEIRNDARDNLITSMLLASNQSIPEVTICFGDHVLRGCRATKTSAGRFTAFQSPNFAPLATVGTEIEINNELIVEGIRIRQKALSFEPSAIANYEAPPVTALRLFPGLTAEILRNVLQPPLKGLVIEAFGVGNCPTHDKDFLTAISEAIERGVVVIAVTQCLEGHVDLQTYEVGQALAELGVVGGSDMTVEAAIAKLFFLLNQNISLDEIKELISVNLVGELTEI